jgi:hypothetical protein
MLNRILFGAALVLAGALCMVVSVHAAAWIDTTHAHENTALNQASLQAQLENKTLNEWTPPPSILSGSVVWSCFAAGGSLALAGCVIGLRTLRTQLTDLRQ